MLIPFSHRKSRFTAWVKVFVSYLEVMQQDLYQLWNRTDAEAKMTPQIMYLEHLLNEKFGTTDIVIDDGVNLGPWIYQSSETPDPEWFVDQANSFIWNNEDQVVIDFVVHIPSDIETGTPELAALVQKYKLPGKRFVIQIS